MHSNTSLHLQEGNLIIVLFESEHFLPVVIPAAACPFEAIVFLKKDPLIWKKATLLIQRKQVLNHESPGMDGSTINFGLFLHLAEELRGLRELPWPESDQEWSYKAKNQLRKSYPCSKDAWICEVHWGKSIYWWYSCIFLDQWLYQSYELHFQMAVGAWLISKTI